jgi:hypothetical protein
MINFARRTSQLYQSAGHCELHASGIHDIGAGHTGRHIQRHNWWRHNSGREGTQLHVFGPGNALRLGWSPMWLVLMFGQIKLGRVQPRV